MKIVFILILLAACIGCASSRRQAYVDSGALLLDWERQAILEGKIWEGMYESQMFASLGKIYPAYSTTYTKCYRYYGITVYTRGGRVAYWVK